MEVYAVGYEEDVICACYRLEDAQEMMLIIAEENLYEDCMYSIHFFPEDGATVKEYIDDYRQCASIKHQSLLGYYGEGYWLKQIPLF